MTKTFLLSPRILIAWSCFIPSLAVMTHLLAADPRTLPSGAHVEDGDVPTFELAFESHEVADDMTDVAFSDDNAFLAVSRLYSSSGHPTPVGSVKVFDFKGNKVDRPMFSRDVPARGITFLGRDTIALAGDVVEVLNFRTGEATILLKDAPYRPHWQRTPISSSKDGRFIACIGRVFDLQTQKIAFEMDETNTDVTEADSAISGNGETVAVLSRKIDRYRLAAYDRSTRKLLASADVTGSLRTFLHVSADGSLVYWSGGTLDVKSGKAEPYLRGEAHGVWTDQQFVLMLTSHYSEFIELYSPASPAHHHLHRIIDPVGEDPWFACLSPSCRYVAVVSGTSKFYPHNDQLEVWTAKKKMP